jgi:riboflavin synthase
VFTGLIDDVGSILAVAVTDAGRELRIGTRYQDLRDGESIAINGACLTVREHGDDWFSVAAVGTTLERTTISEWCAGRRVNLERALAIGDRLGGHIVQGHVDAVARVASVARQGDAVLVDLALPEQLSELIVPQGSLTVDGVSLTVLEVVGDRVARLSLIEYTLRHTTLGGVAEGDAVHVEADIIGKFVRKLVGPYLSAPRPSEAVTR